MLISTIFETTTSFVYNSITASLVSYNGNDTKLSECRHCIWSDTDTMANEVKKHKTHT